MGRQPSGHAVPVLHLAQELCLGGCCRDMENLASLATKDVFVPVLAGLRGDLGYLSELRARGFRAAVTGEDLKGLPDLLGGESRFAVVVHRSGEQNHLWNSVFLILRQVGAAVIIERNIFGYVDKGPAANLRDLTFFNSLHTMWKHWTASGKPSLDGYIGNYWVIHSAVTASPPSDELSTSRQRIRDKLGIGPDAFVIGHITRSDPVRLDYMSVAILPRLVRELPNLQFLARSFPSSLAKDASKRLGGRFQNLPPTTNPVEMIETYSAMDTLVHFSSMGESFGMAIAEAMYYGLPVVTNETPGFQQGNAQRELVIHGKTGFLANDPVSVVKRLVELAHSPELRQKMGEAGRARFLTGPLAPQTIIGQLEGIIARIAHEKDWGIPGIPPLTERQPSDEQMREYLLNYKSSYTVAPLPRNLQETVWNGKVDLQRFFWRVRRKFL